MLVFWPDDTEKAAANKLRQLLFKSQGERWSAFLESQDRQLRLGAESDLGMFRQALAEADWFRALQLYEGEFLEGVAAKGAYSDWLNDEREAFQRDFQQATLAYAAELEVKREYGSALTYLGDLLRRDPLAEEALQVYLRCAYQGGQREEALKVFEKFEHDLATEMKVSPSGETLGLAERLREPNGFDLTAGLERVETEGARGTISTRVRSRFEPRRDTANRTLPGYAGDFVGREVELAELATALKEDIRVLSVLGAGGMGKTRLAVQLAKEQESRFTDGVVFVSLAAIGSADVIDVTILKALGLMPRANQAPQQLLLSYLKTKDLLLVLDNFEHVLEGADTVFAIVENTERVKVLITTREPLGCYGEHIFSLKGLSYPDSLQDDFTEVYDSVQLFLRSARKVHREFDLSGAGKRAVATICRLLEGMPLGIELAASWARLMPAEGIAEELQNNLELIRAQGQATSRHESWRAVLQHSWSLLSSDERAALMAVSVFQGGFDKEAAKSVAVTSLRTLLNLVNKSLLDRAADGRFSSHTLVREFGREKLSEQPDLLREAEARHAAYFLGVAAAQEGDFGGHGEARALAKLEREHDNFRAALTRAFEHDAALALQLCASLGRFWGKRSHQLEARSCLQKALAVSQVSPSYAKAQREYGWLIYLLGEFPEAQRLVGQSLALSRQLGDDAGGLAALNYLCYITVQLCDFEAAQHYADEGLELATLLDNPYAQAVALFNTAVIHLHRGELEPARSLLEDTLKRFRRLGDNDHILLNLKELGNTAIFARDYETALAYFEEQAETAQRQGNPYEVAAAQHAMAVTHMKLRDFPKAKAGFDPCLTLMQEVGDRDGLGFVFDNLGLIAREEGHYDLARDAFEQSLEHRVAIGRPRGFASLFSRMACLAALQGRAERAATLWGASDAIIGQTETVLQPAYHDYFERDSARAKQTLGETRYEEAWREGHRLTLEEAVTYARETAAPGR